MSKLKRRGSIPRPALLLALTLVLLVFVGFLSVFNPFHREQVVIGQIRQLKGDVALKRIGPQWLCGIVCKEWMVAFDRVVLIDFDYDSIFPRTGDGERLHLKQSQVKDEHVKSFSGLAYLETLRLTGTQVSDSGLKYISELSNLSELALEFTQISGDGLRHLNGQRTLQSLNLTGTQINDDGLKHLADLTNLQYLWIADTPVTDVGLDHLSHLSNLQYLCIANTHVTDVGVRSLRKKMPTCNIFPDTFWWKMRDDR